MYQREPRAPWSSPSAPRKEFPNFVARTTWSRRPWRTSPRNVSDSPYTSAVSKRVTPTSTAASTTARVASTSSRRPKLFQPSPTTETTRPDDPSRRYCMSLTNIGHYPAPCGRRSRGLGGKRGGWRFPLTRVTCRGEPPPTRRMFGGDLLSHPVPRAVPSALTGLASGFGMEPGVSPSLWPPKHYGDDGTGMTRPHLGNRIVDASTSTHPRVCGCGKLSAY